VRVIEEDGRPAPLAGARARDERRHRLEPV
jgi:hypothetical protein